MRSADPQPENVMIVDPSIPRRIALAQRLQDKGIGVVLASDGQVALDILEATPESCLPILIAAELVLPRLSGPALMAALKRLPGLADIPVILFSGAASDPPGSRRPGVTPLSLGGITAGALEGAIESRLRIQRSLRRLAEARAVLTGTT